MNTESLDLRGVEAPKPLLTVLSKVASLPPDTNLDVILDQNPFQLYDLLQQRGWTADFSTREDGAVRLQAIRKGGGNAH